MKKHTIGFLGLKVPKHAKNASEFLDFSAPPFTGKDAVTAPASGRTRRSMTAKVYRRSDGAPVSGREINYTLEGNDVPGVELEGAMLVIHSAVDRDCVVTVKAQDAASGLFAYKKVEIKKDASLHDVPPSPLQKEGWELVFHDEFDGDTLDVSKWSPYYLRHWCDTDDRTKADFFFEDGALVLRCPEDAGPWSQQDGGVKVKGIMSMEKSHLHKYGEPGKGACVNRFIPTFEGYATKYGYFELRLRMPDTKDGSHFAWWMVGTQDDQHCTAMLEGEPAPYYGHHSNEVGEFDIIETYLSSQKKMKAWRPVIHTNGTTDYEYLWPPKFEMPGNPSLEYHNFGFEWDENGTKFYVDGKLAAETDRSPNYRMMTFLSTYAVGGMGKDRGIYPKDTRFQYFRVYKKKEPPRASTVVLNQFHTPDYLFVPEEGSLSVSMSAEVLDQFDRVMPGEPVRFKLSRTIDGFAPSKPENTAQVEGVTVDGGTGTITVTPAANPATDVFLTAYVNDKVKQTRHVKLSKEPSRPFAVRFLRRQKTIKRGTVRMDVGVFDQYGSPCAGEATCFLAADITARDTVNIPGVTCSEDGCLTIADTVPVGTPIVLAVRTGGLLDTMVMTLQD